MISSLIDGQFIANLTSLLMQLLCIKYVVDCVVSDIPLSKEGPLLQKFRSNCLWIIQRNEAAITDPQDSTKLSSNVLVLDTYCLCESTLAFLSQLQVNSIEEAQTNGSLKVRVLAVIARCMCLLFMLFSFCYTI